MDGVPKSRTSSILLTLGQIHSALAYDHREELDRDIQQRLERVTELRRVACPSPLFGEDGIDSVNGPSQ